MERFDGVVLGADPAGEVAVGALAEAGLRVTIVERELCGGECSSWANREATTLEEIPESAVVIGAGPVGLELGQALARFGSQVTIVDVFDRAMPREDPQVGEAIQEAFDG